MMTNLAQYTDIRVALVVGGLSLNVQAATLRTSPEIVVATPVSALLQFLALLERAYHACPTCCTSQEGLSCMPRNSPPLVSHVLDAVS
jgi:hypothetical protein